MVATGQIMLAAAEAGLATTSLVANARVGVCYQPSSGGPISNFVGFAYINIEIDTPRTPVGAVGRAAVPAGTYNVGFCAWNYGPVAIDSNDWVNGWVMVLN